MSEVLMKTVIDCETGEQQVVPLTPEEIADHAEMNARFLAEQEAIAQEEEAKAALKASAKAKLIAGEALSPEEADVLLF